MVVHGTTAHCERAHPQASMNPMRPLGPALASGVPAPDHGLVPLARICPADVPSQPIQPPNRLCGCDPLTFFRRYGRPRHVGLLGAQRVDGQSVVRSFVRSSSGLLAGPEQNGRCLDQPDDATPCPLDHLQRRSHGRVTDYEWLPRTKANLARTNLVIPRGFKEVS